MFLMAGVSFLCLLSSCSWARATFPWWSVPQAQGSHALVYPIFRGRGDLALFLTRCLALGFVHFPPEPLSLKDAVDFTMVHGSFYNVCVFGWWRTLHQS